MKKLTVARAGQNPRGQIAKRPRTTSPPRSSSLIAPSSSFNRSCSPSRVPWRTPRPKKNLNELRGVIRQVLGAEGEVVVAGQDFIQDKTRLSDSLLALKIASRERAEVNELVVAYRLLDLIERAAKRDTGSDSREAILAALDRPILLPEALFPITPIQPRILMKRPGRSTKRVRTKRVRSRRRSRGSMGPSSA